MFIGMPKLAKVLTAKEVNSINITGWHAVGGVAGLLLQIRESKGLVLSRSWILRTKVGTIRKPIGLGSYPQTSLAEAREKAKKTLQDIQKGIDPVAEKKRIRSVLLAAQDKYKTFKECAIAYMDEHANDYKSDKHRKQWGATLETYAYPIFGQILVSDINQHKVIEVLTQKIYDDNGKELGTFWDLRTVTAIRLQGRMKKVFDLAIFKGYRTEKNPATWAGNLSIGLSKPSKEVKHQPAIPYIKIGDFMVHLRKNKSISAKALNFLILTAVRSGAVRNANWSEIDFDNNVWIIPKENTKTKKFEHRVPLCPQAIELLKTLPIIDQNSKIFPSPKGGALSDMALSEIMRGMRERGELIGEGVPHGFRSTFRDWAAEQTAYPDEIRKTASGHLVGDAVQQAYQRTDLLEKRRNLMKEWGDFLDKPSLIQQSKVLQIRKTANA